MTRRSQGTSTPVRSWRWRWVGPALLVLNVIVNLMNPRLTPGLHMIWWFVMLPLTIIVLGYTLYKPRHGFLDTGAELTRPCLVNIGSTSNHAASWLHKPLNMYEAEH
jgi:hypothetical protein